MALRLRDKRLFPSASSFLSNHSSGCILGPWPRSRDLVETPSEWSSLLLISQGYFLKVLGPLSFVYKNKYRGISLSCQQLLNNQRKNILNIPSVYRLIYSGKKNLKKNKKSQSISYTIWPKTFGRGRQEESQL